MDFFFTNHAEEKIIRRKLLKEEIVEALRHPDTISKKRGKHYYQKKISRGMIEIVTEMTEKGLNVITVYWI